MATSQSDNVVMFAPIENFCGRCRKWSNYNYVGPARDPGYVLYQCSTPACPMTLAYPLADIVPDEPAIDWRDADAA